MSKAQKNTETKERGRRLSDDRLMIETHLAAHDCRTWTTTQVRKEIIDSRTVPNYMESMRVSGLLRLVGTDERGHNLYVWHTSSIQAERKFDASIAPPRVYVNSTMPNGSQDYWRQAMSWGR